MFYLTVEVFNYCISNIMFFFKIFEYTRRLLNMSFFQIVSPAPHVRLPDE